MSIQKSIVNTMHTLELCKVLSGAKTATADDYISFSEFRMICVCAKYSMAPVNVQRINNSLRSCIVEL